MKKRKVNISCLILLFTIFHDYFCGMFLYFFPLIAALIGWLFNWIFVRYLFGKAIPAKAPAIASGVGRYLSGSLFNADQMAAKLTDPATLQELTPVIESHIDIFLKEKLKEKMPAIAMFIGEKTIDLMKKSLMEEIDLLLPELLGRYIGNISDKLDIEKVLVKAVASLPEGKIEELLYQYSGKERLLFQVWGALAGLVIGVVLVLLTSIGG